MLGLQSPTWIAKRYARNRETPLVPCRSLPKGCASQDGQPSKSGACAAHPSAPCATKLEASSSRAGRCSREQSCRLCLAGRGEDVRACGVVTRVIKADRSPAVTHSNLWVSLASRNEHFHYISLYPDNAPSFVLSFVLIPVRVRQPRTRRQTDSSVRLWFQRRPHNVIHLAAAPDIWLLLRANREDLLEKVAKATLTDRQRDRRRRTLTRADTPISHRMGGPLDRQVPLPPETQCDS